MESIGQKLAKIRQAKGLSIEHVASETHISRRYIEGLENEHFDIFPGETYLLGFLRKYADYLEVSPQDAVNLYKNQLIQEQPPPIEELLNPHFTFPWKPVLAGLAIVLVVVAGIALFTRPAQEGTPERTARNDSRDTAIDQAASTVHMQSEFLERRFFIGDIVTLPFSDQLQYLKIASLQGNVVLEGPQGQQWPIDFGSSARIDVDGDGELDLLVTAAVKTESPGIVLNINRSLDNPERAAVRPGGESESDVNYAQAVGSTNLDERVQESVVLLEADEIQPIRVEVSAMRSPVMVRLQAADGGVQQEYLQPGRRMEMESTDFVQLYMSNSGAAEVSVNSQKARLGEPGQVRVMRFAWNNRFGSGGPRLEQVPVY